MNCPLCVDQVLDERFSHGIEVDVCPNKKRFSDLLEDVLDDVLDL